MSNRLVGLAGGLLALGLAACRTPNVEVDWDPAASFEQARTWSWAPRRARIEQPDPRVHSDLVHERIEAAIELVLAERGYARVDKEPDLLVAYHAAIHEALDRTTLYNQYHLIPRAGGWALRPGVHVERYEVGSLVIDLIERRSNELVWRGRARSRLQDLDDPAERAARTEAAVRAILERFPPEP